MRLFKRKLSLAYLLLLLVILALVAIQPLATDIPIYNILPEFEEDKGQMGQAEIQIDIARLPLSFIANAGQADANVRFMVKAGEQTIFFTPQEILFATSEGAEGEVPRSSVVRLRFTGANEEVKVEGESPLPGVANFFLGNDPKQWRANVPTYAAITYHDLYPGIDLIYSGKQGRLKSEFVVAPGADPTLITMAYSGASSKYVRKDGALVLETPFGKLVEAPPLVYQVIDEARVTVEGCYCLLGNGKVAFIVGEYVLTEPLIIDPALIYSTYLGGSGDDNGYGIAVDSLGNAYITGETGSVNFPTQDPLQPDWCGYSDVFVTKLNPTGSALAYSTFLGGSGGDLGYAIAVDGLGNAYITGYTYSADFPTKDPLQPNYGGREDVFVAKLNASGSALIYSTYLGGSAYDYCSGIAVDSLGNAYITGFTESVDFPTQDPLQPDLRGVVDAVVAKLNPTGSGLVYSTYLGGSRGDAGWGIAVDGLGNAYITGGTFSVDFPTQDPFQPNHGGNLDAFVVKLNALGSGLVYSTCFGGSNDDGGWGIAVDGSGNVYITGFTRSVDFPTQDPLQPNHGGYNDAFVAKIAGVTNQPPIADAGPDQTVADTDGNGQEEVTLDGSGSYDPDGTIVCWAWKLNGTVITMPDETPTVVTLVIGEHTITLEVTDDLGARDTDVVVITVIAPSVHTVSTPNTPSGPSSGQVGESLTFSTGGSTCSQGHSVQYRFDWGNGNYSSWSSTTSTSYSYSSTGTYQVKAQARCASDTSVVSNWSGAKTVAIGAGPPAHTVSTPNTPSGPSSGQVGESLTFSTSGSTCSQGHSVQYRFDWGDGNYSTWSSSTSASYNYVNTGTYQVKAQARCASDTSVVSNWSGAKTVSIGTAPPAHTVSTPNTPSGPSSGQVGESLSFSTGGAACSQGHSVQYRFDWGDGNYSNWSPSTSVSHTYSATGTYQVRAQARCTSDMNRPGIAGEFKA